MTSEPFARCVLTAQADLDPTVGARILGLATVAGDVPESFQARRIGGELLRITLELREPDPQATRLLAAKIRNIPTVVSVELAWCGELRRSA